MNFRPSFLRHAAWIDPSQLNFPLVIIGCGALGSHVALFAAKMGFTNFILFDPDKVESHNLPNQAFDLRHIGVLKVDALEKLLWEFNGEIRVQKYPEFFTEAHASCLQGFVVIATDNMESRKKIIELCSFNTNVEMLFEGRLGFDYGEVNIVSPMNIDEIDNFTKSLRDDKDVPEGPCNLRICLTLVSVVAGYLVHQMCAAVVCQKNNSSWDRKPKNIFSFTNNGLTHVSL